MNIKNLKLKKWKHVAPKVKVVTKPVSAAKPGSVEAKVDDLANQYLLHRDRAKSEQAQADKVNEQIKEFAGDFGQHEDKSLMAYGQRFVVGVSETAASEKLDVEKMRTVLPKALFQRCIQHVEVPNEDLIQELVTTGEITKKQFLKCLSVSRAPFKRVYVATLRDHMKGKQKRKDASEVESD